jgi:di/tricarboxylate transporter
MWITFGVILATVAFFAWEKYPIELVGFASLAVMLVVFHVLPVLDENGRNRLDAAAILSGFANHALITVLALMVLGQAIVRTHALEGVVNLILKVTGAHWRWSVWVLFFIAMVLSGFVNNTPIIVIMIPILQAMATQLRIAPSKIMMRVNMAVILGGMTTVIGSSTNLLAAGIFESMVGRTVGMFDITPIGAVLALAGFAYVLGIAPKLLPARESLSTAMAGDSGRQYLAQITIGERSALVGRSPVAGVFPGLKDVTVQMVQRGEHAELPPFDHLGLAAGDVLLVAATRKSLTEAVLKDPGLLADVDASPGDGPDAADRRPPTQRALAEVMIAPASRMIGQSVEMIGFRRLYNCIVVGIQRRSRMIRAKLSEIRLEAGDVLLLQGHRNDLRALRGNPDLILMEWSQTELPSPHLAQRVGLILAVMLALIAFEIVPTVTAALGAAVMTIIAKALNIRQAARAIDRRIVVLVACSIALSKALEATSGSAWLAGGIIGLLGPEAGPLAVVSTYFFVVMVSTNFLSNNACALLFTPIGVGLAASLGVDPLLFLMATIYASDSSFATPIGYQTNILVMGPGQYRFVDYLRAGIPLNLLLWVVFTVAAAVYYGLV